ncbi:MAG: hypothetical protein KC731_08300, partial [Myxococcales bacterium]|nr:hypothetical protein [Myxococcales bacterium]
PRFGRDLPARVHALLADREAPPTGIVVDLRGCPGGHLEAAARAADLFVPRGSLLFERRRPDGSRQPFRARRAAVASLPLVLVIDGGTASAAELFAGALAQLGRATLVGEPSFGKSAALSLVADGEAYRLADDGTCLLAGDRDLATHPLQPHHPCPAQDALSEAHSLVLPLVLPLALPAGDRSWTS